MLRQLLVFALTITFLSIANRSFAQDSTKTDAPPPTGVEERIFEKVDIEASVNIVAWRRHLENALMAPLMNAAEKGIKSGSYTVNVRFLVEKDGKISKAVALNDPGYGLAEASEKVIKTGPRWNPGEQNGKKVRSYHTQPINFQIANN